MITIAALLFSLKLGALIDRLHVPEPQQTCGIETTSYLFKGEPGTEFRYAGETVRLPESGSIELIATRSSAYEVAGRKISLSASSAADQFGRRTVQVPPLPGSRTLLVADNTTSLESVALPAIRPKH